MKEKDIINRLAAIRKLESKVKSHTHDVLEAIHQLEIETVIFREDLQKKSNKASYKW